MNDKRYLVMAVIWVCLSFCDAACVNGVSNNLWESGEECDGGLGCTTSCTCATGFQSTSPYSPSCIEVCSNPLSPMSTVVDSSVTATMTSSVVEFHVLVKHQTNSSSGSHVVETTITFGNGTMCDYPVNNKLILQALNTDICHDDYAITSVPFSGFSPCLIPSCVDKNGNDVANCNPSLCTAPPCRKRWSNSIKISRTFMINSELGFPFAVSSTAYHPVEFQFPWIQSSSLSTATWSTPNVAGSSVITGIDYNAVTNLWTVNVTSALNWPFILVKPDPDATIKDQNYTVSVCSSTPSLENPCTQTITISVPGCNGLHTVFGGNSTLITGLKYGCWNYLDGCPLPTDDVRDAIISVVLDSKDPCLTSPGAISSGIVASDISFSIVQPTQSSDPTAPDKPNTTFVEGDPLNFELQITQELDVASIAGISVVSFRETNYHYGITFAVTKVLEPAIPCGLPNAMCISFDTTQLTGVPDQPQTTLLFVMIIQVELAGIEKKRSILDFSNFQLTKEVTMLQNTPSAGSLPIPAVILFFMLVIRLFL